MVTEAVIPRVTHRAAAMSIATVKPWPRGWPGPARMPAVTGNTATASSPATRAMALLTPEAIPAWLSDRAARTAAVSGATVIARPTPKTTTAGSTARTCDAPGHDADHQRQTRRSNQGRPSSGAADWCAAQGPPADGEPISMMTVVGSIAVPAANAE